MADLTLDPAIMDGMLLHRVLPQGVMTIFTPDTFLELIPPINITWSCSMHLSSLVAGYTVHFIFLCMHISLSPFAEILVPYSAAMAC